MSALAGSNRPVSPLLPGREPTPPRSEAAATSPPLTHSRMTNKHKKGDNISAKWEAFIGWKGSDQAETWENYLAKKEATRRKEELEQEQVEEELRLLTEEHLPCRKKTW